MFYDNRWNTEPSGRPVRSDLEQWMPRRLEPSASRLCCGTGAPNDRLECIHMTRDRLGPAVPYVSRSALGHAVGSVIREARRAQRLSLVKLAATSGVDSSTPEKIEKGRSPSLYTFVRLAFGVSVPPGDLLNRAIALIKAIPDQR